MLKTKKACRLVMRDIIAYLDSKNLELTKKYKSLDKSFKKQYPNGAPSGYFEINQYERDWKELRALFREINATEVAQYNATELLKSLSRRDS